MWSWAPSASLGARSGCFLKVGGAQLQAFRDEYVVLGVEWALSSRPETFGLEPLSLLARLLPACPWHWLEMMMRG